MFYNFVMLIENGGYGFYDKIEFIFWFSLHAMRVDVCPSLLIWSFPLFLICLLTLRISSIFAWRWDLVWVFTCSHFTLIWSVSWFFFLSNLWSLANIHEGTFLARKMYKSLFLFFLEGFFNIIKKIKRTRNKKWQLWHYCIAFSFAVILIVTRTTLHNPHQVGVKKGMKIGLGCSSFFNGFLTNRQHASPVPDS